jgi:type IV pilus assembly protein PilA
VRQHLSRSSGSNPILVVLVVVIVGFGAVAVIGILSAIAIPQFASYRIKAYNSAAMADLKNAKTSVEAYYADHNNQYPESLDTLRIPKNKDVEIKYEKTGKNNYIIITTHEKGDRVYAVTSDTSEIRWKNKKDPDGQFISL